MTQRSDTILDNLKHARGTLLWMKDLVRDEDVMIISVFQVKIQQAVNSINECLDNLRDKRREQ